VSIGVLFSPFFRLTNPDADDKKSDASDIIGGDVVIHPVIRIPQIVTFLPNFPVGR
jgi:hypothetical protein